MQHNMYRAYAWNKELLYVVYHFLLKPITSTKYITYPLHNFYHETNVRARSEACKTFRYASYAQ